MTSASARGFQGKAPELWPSALGPRPEPKKFIPVRHDAAGLWLFKNEPSLTALGEQLILRLLPSEREKIFQSVLGHHGEPLALNFRGGVAAIVNSEVQIGKAAQLAATELAEAIYAVFEPPGIRHPKKPSRLCHLLWPGSPCWRIGSARTAIGFISRRREAADP